MTSLASAATASTSDRRRWIALVVVCLGQLMIIIDTTIVNVALPFIQQDLRFSQANLTWVVNAYLITFGSFLLLAGRLGDLIGRKRVFMSGLVIFTTASVLCGVAQDQAMLIAARFLQGLGGAVASSVIIAIIVTEFPRPGDRASAMSVYMAVVTGGASIGLLLGGVLTEAINWHWIFFINVPIGLVTLALGKALITENEGLGLGQGVDVLGSILVTAAMMIGVYAIVTSADSGWASVHTLGLGGLAVALLVAFLALESRIANPILPLRILRLRSLTVTSAVRAVLATGMFSAFFLGALYLDHVLGYSAIQTGLAFLPLSLGVGVLSLGVTTRLVARFGPKRTLIPGLAVTLLGLVLLSQVGVHTSYFPLLFTAFLLLGLGAGASFTPLLLMAMAEVPKRDAGLASGIVNVSMQISAAIGLAALGAVSTDRTRTLVSEGHSVASALTGGYHLAFVIAGVLVAAGIVVAVVALRSPDPAGAEEPPAPVLPADREVEPQAHAW